MNKKISKKQLVRRLMDQRHVTSIFITRDYINVEVDAKFTPTMAKDFIADTGFENVRLACKDGSNYMIFSLD